MSANAMNPDALKPELLTVDELFSHGNVYTVPIYQRNYAWRAAQIEQLISDIQDAAMGHESSYFLGNLVVTPRAKPNDFEVIDGQQRLTTLYLLLTFLEHVGPQPYDRHKGRLQYESRARASEALRRVGQASYRDGRQVQDSLTEEDGGIHEGFNIIHQTIETKFRDPVSRGQFAEFLRFKVTVVRASLPPTTDLNRYFEIMNTRGQQLLQVDIVKARLMSKLPDAERAGFAWIWDACADMDTYVQMSLARGDTGLRSTIFGDDWCWLVPTDFNALLRMRSQFDASTSTFAAVAALSLEGALQKYAQAHVQESSVDEGNERFRSTIEFPVFLLHVLKVKNGQGDENEGQLDDKHLIASFTNAMPTDHEAQWVRDFAFTLLKCRNLFDAFILKRQFTTSTDSEEGDWSLQRLKKNTSSATPGYVHTFRTDTATDEPDTATHDALLLQSMLRITYTSPRTMHWMTQTLHWLAQQPKPQDIQSADLAHLLKNFARAKVASAFLHAEPQPQGFGIARIVFTYLDYLLLDETAKKNFKFQFRNSIEHFYPQNPNEAQSGASVSPQNLHLLGNLALVSVSANSHFSNNLPKAKAETFRLKMEPQSPKLGLMAEITRSEGWSDEQVKNHHNEMVALLKADIQ
jgi:hypothetical protein